MFVLKVLRDVASLMLFGNFNQKNSHRLLFSRASAESPRDASSAGFCEESMCLHCEAAAISCIVATRLATKVWKRFLSFRRYPKTQVLSVQNTDSSTFMSVSVLMILSSLAATTAALNSNRGIVRRLSGDSRDFPMTNEQWMRLCAFVMRR